jgi:thiol:disulfide interchange protein
MSFLDSSKYKTTMKKLVFIATTLIIFIGSTVSAQGIEFLEVAWKDAMKKAKAENKLMFVDAYTTWCGPCKVMAANVFTQAEAGEMFNNNFINLKIDMEKADGLTFGQEYPIRAYPTLLFIDGDGKVVKKVVGGQQLPGLISHAKEALTLGDNTALMDDKYNAGERSYDFMLKYATALNRSNKPNLKAYNDYIASNPSISEAELLVFVFEAAVEADSKIFEKMVDNSKKIKETVGEATFNIKVEKALNNTIDKAIKYESESLIDEAIKMQKNLLSDNKSFALMAKMKYYKNYRMPTEYTQVAEEFSKKIIKDDLSKAIDLIQDMVTTFGSDPTVSSLANKLAKQVYAKDNSIKNLTEYCNTCIVMGKKQEALEIANKHRDQLKKEKKEIGEISELIQAIERL